MDINCKSIVKLIGFVDNAITLPWFYKAFEVSIDFNNQISKQFDLVMFYHNIRLLMIKGYKNPIITYFKLTKAQYESTIISTSLK